MKKILEAEKKVNAINLDSILYTLVKRKGWTEWSMEKAKEIEKLYRYFLILVISYPDKNIVPTKEIDTFWHTHILDTEKYMEDCNNAFGYYVHHFPYFGLRGTTDEKIAKDSFLETCYLFKKHFDVSLLDNIARCSSHCRSACGPKNTAIDDQKNAYRPTL